MQETQEMWVQSLGLADAPEKEMAPHSSILAWGIPWTEEPCKLQSMGLQRVGHDWTHTHIQVKNHSLFVRNDINALYGTSQVALVVKNLSANAGKIRDEDSIPGLGRSPGEGNDNPLQYSCLVNPMDKGTWQATVHGVAKSWTWLKWFNMHARFHATEKLRNQF